MKTKEAATEYQRQWRAAHPNYAKDRYRRLLGLPTDIGKVYGGRPVLTDAERKERIRERQRRRETRARLYIRAAKERPCADCGTEYPYYVMQFDHLGDKAFDLSKAGGYGLAKVQAEIDKCEVVCANCHAARSFHRLT